MAALALTVALACVVTLTVGEMATVVEPDPSRPPMKMFGECGTTTSPAAAGSTAPLLCDTSAAPACSCLLALPPLGTSSHMQQQPWLRPLSGADLSAPNPTGATQMHEYGAPR